MDLDPLQPDEPVGDPLPVVPAPGWAWNDPAAGAGGEQWAPGTESDSTVAGHGPWDTEAPGSGAGGPRPPRFSRRTKVLAGATALLTCVAAAWAAGSAGGSHTPTVRIEPAVAAANGSTGSTSASGSSSSGSTGSGPAGSWNGVHRGRFGGMFAARGAGGTVATVDATAQSFTVTRPQRPAPPTSSTSTTSTTAAPATTSVTVTTSSTTTYQEYESATFSSSDAPVGTRIAAVGTRNADGSLTATTITVVPAGMGPHPHASAPSASGGTTTTLAPRTIPPNAAARLSKAPFAFGQVSATTGSPAVLTLTTPWGTETVDTTATTTFTSLVSTGITFDTLAVGQHVVIRGQRQSNGDVAASAVTIIPAGVTPSPLGFGGPGFGGAGFAGRGQPGGPAGASGTSGSGGPGGPGGPWAGFGRFGRGRPAPAPVA